MSPENMTMLPRKKIKPGRHIRDQLDHEKVENMAQSIRTVGQLQPIRVYIDGQWYITIDGHYRLEALGLLEAENVMAIVETKELGEGQIIQRQLISNCQRSDMKPLELARALDRLIESSGWTAGEAGQQIGFSDAKVSGLRKLLELPQSIREHIESGKLPVSTAIELARIEDPEQQTLFAAQAVEGLLTRDGIAGTRKASKRSTPTSDSTTKATRVTAKLGGERSITISEQGGLTLERLIQSLEELLSKARKIRSQGVELRTFIKMLADQARVDEQPEGGAA